MSEIMPKTNLVTYNRVDTTSDGLAIYEIKNQTTQKVQKCSVPEKNVDKFEKFIDKSYGDFGYFDNPLKVAQKSHKYCMLGAIVGGATSAYLTRNSSTIKKILGSIGGSVVGILGAAIIATASIVRKALNFAKTGKELGVKIYQEENDNQAFPSNKSEIDMEK